MRVWIAEKPDMGRKVAKALGGGQESGGSIKVGKDEVVTWAIGHLLEDLMPHEYDERYKKWKLEDLPIIPKQFKRKPQDGKTAQLKVVVGLIKKASEIVIATDAGREGEAIAWHLLDHAGWKKGAQRLWTSSLGEDHLKKAVRQLIDDSQKKSLYTAAKLRGAMDWSDGINLSRLYNIRLVEYGDKVLSLGRVQTATLAILVDRDNEIANFKPSDYYELRAPIRAAGGEFDLFHRPSESRRILDPKEAQRMARDASQQDCVLKVETKPVTMRPSPPFSLPELQMAASRKWGWGAKRTLDEVQKLYEAGLVTYPRTDTGCLTSDLKKDMPKHLSALRRHPDFRSLADITPEYRNTVFNDKKVEDHHGIIPTDQACDPARLAASSRDLFDLIARRFLASLMPDAKGRRTTVSTTLAGLVFKTGGTIIDVMGWKAVWSGQDDPTESSKKDEDQAILPPVSDKERARSLDVEAQTKTTKPPPHYTEGTLLKAMLNAGSKDEDSEIRDLLSNGGLGTQATRQEIIEKLKYRDFARIEGKKIISTQRARDFVDILRSESSRLVDVVATADLERRLREVEKDPSKMPDIWREYVSGLRQEIDVLRRTPVKRKLPASPGGRGGSPKRKSGGRSAPKGGRKYGGKSSGASKAGGKKYPSGGRKSGSRRKKA